MTPPRPRGVARRSFLRSLLLSLAAFAAFPGSGRAARDARSPRALPPADRAIAALAVGFQHSQPAAAARIARSVAAELPPRVRWFASPEQKARQARAQLLAGARVAAELARGDVALLDGWVLARSEAALAVYLRDLAPV